MTQMTDDRLAEIENGFIGHPEDDYYFVEAKDFAWLLGEVRRLQHELARYEAEIARLRECRDKAASLMHLANQAMYGLAD